MEYHRALQYGFEMKPSPAFPIHNHPPPPLAAVDPYYLQRHPAPTPATAAATANSEIHTLFISGLPDDVKAREIHNLFRRRHGFDSCLLEYTGRGNQVVAFATFSNHQSAVAAMAELNGVSFDPATGASLNIRLARSNSRRRPRGDGAYDIFDKRTNVKNEEQNTWTEDGNGGSDEPLRAENDNSSKKSALAAAQSGDSESKTDAAQASRNVVSENSLANDISPCSTLFIANLSPTCSEEELKQIFSECRGFLVLKMQGKRGKPVAFADFSDIEASTEAREKLRGNSQAAADDEGLYVEYAKSKMKKT